MRQPSSARRSSTTASRPRRATAASSLRLGAPACPRCLRPDVRCARQHRHHDRSSSQRLLHGDSDRPQKGLVNLRRIETLPWVSAVAVGCWRSAPWSTPSRAASAEQRRSLPRCAPWDSPQDSCAAASAGAPPLSPCAAAVACRSASSPAVGMADTRRLRRRGDRGAAAPAARRHHGGRARRPRHRRRHHPAARAGTRMLLPSSLTRGTPSRPAMIRRCTCLHEDGRSTR